MDLRNGELQVRARFWPVIRTAVPASLPRDMGTSTVGTERSRAASAGTRLEAPTRNARASGPRPRRDHRAALRIVSSFLRRTRGTRHDDDQSGGGAQTCAPPGSGDRGVWRATRLTESRQSEEEVEVGDPRLMDGPPGGQHDRPACRSPDELPRRRRIRRARMRNGAVRRYTPVMPWSWVMSCPGERR